MASGPPVSSPAFNVKHLVPKTRLSHTIMHENPTQATRLQNRLEMLDAAQRRARVLHDQMQRSFRAELRRKGNQWVHEDEQGLLTMNLPFNHHQSLQLEGPDVNVLYTSPRYDITVNQAEEVARLTGPILPISRVTKDAFQIYEKNGQILLRRLPHHFKIRQARLARHDFYRGHTWQQSGSASEDYRFEGLERQLSMNNLHLPSLSTGHIAPPSKERTLLARLSLGFPQLGNSSPENETSSLLTVPGIERQRTVSNLLLRRSSTRANTS